MGELRSRRKGENEPENQRKKFRKTVIGIGSFVLLLVIAIIAVIMSASKTPAGELTKQLDLSERYLSELNYEQAIVAYRNVIEIDPKCVEAYIGLADIYIAMKYRYFLVADIEQKKISKGE